MALYLDGQKIISGGGGSGGHTIIDSEGVSLEQRTNLQFNGTYSEDNATDDTTEINVVREMTKAEFDELTEDEKTGLINVTDVTANADDKFQPVIYSTEEREIGVWIDGKPLYLKVFTNVSITNSKPQVIDNSISYDTLVDYNIVTTSGVGGSLSSESGIYATLMILNNALALDKRQSSDWSGATFSWISVKYTKTTDTAGSGTWTPQGVPAVHYSTEEQVVGTWIDGSTLYEKTFFLSQRTPITNDYTTYIIDDTTIYDIDNIISCEIFDSNSDSAPLTKLAYLERAIDVIKSNNKLIAFYNANNTYKMTGFILRYTKSST